jgi:hypothetical protein
MPDDNKNSGSIRPIEGEEGGHKGRYLWVVLLCCKSSYLFCGGAKSNLPWNKVIAKLITVYDMNTVCVQPWKIWFLSEFIVQW